MGVAGGLAVHRQHQLVLPAHLHVLNGHGVPLAVVVLDAVRGGHVQPHRARDVKLEVSASFF